MKRNFASYTLSASPAECLKTKCLYFSIFYYFMTHSMMKRKAKTHRALCTTNMLKEKNEKVFKDYEKTIFCASFGEAC